MARRHSRRSYLLGSAALCLGPSVAWAAAPLRLVVLVAKGSPARELSLSELRQMYLGRRVSIGGQASVPFSHPARTQDRVAFDRLVLRMDPEEAARYWIDQRIRGGSPPPRTTDSAAVLLRTLARLPGAIGYIREGFTSADLRMLAIDGKLPNHADYPLIYRP